MANTSVADEHQFNHTSKILKSLRVVFANLWASYVAQRQHQALAQVSNHTLARLGISRGELARRAMSMTAR